MLLSEAKQALHALANRLHDAVPDRRERAESELAELLLYLIRVANRSGLDLMAAAGRKVQRDSGLMPQLMLKDESESKPPRALRILIVEDERIVAADLQQMLRELGYDAFAIAATGAEAVALSRQSRPDIALMDIRIRGLLDGVETAMQLRREFNTAVIFLTAHSDDATLKRAIHAEPYGYLLKPVNAPLLKTTIELASHRHGCA
jgi:two-component system, response regulator PdtaR